MIRELQTRYGIMHIPDTDTAQYGWLDVTGAAGDDENIDLIRDLLTEKPPGMVIDVGACYGVWTLALARSATACVAFEPQPAVYDLLVQNVAANGLENVATVRQLVGDMPGVDVMAHLSVDRQANFGGLAVRERNQDQPDAPMDDIPVTTIDAVARGIPVSFIKIDTEGGECAVLQGARETIMRCRPIIFLETEHPRTDKDVLGAILTGMGYAVEARYPDALCVPV